MVGRRGDRRIEPAGRQRTLAEDDPGWVNEQYEEIRTTLMVAANRPLTVQALRCSMTSRISSATE
jgi:hypothetical protein